MVSVGRLSTQKGFDLALEAANVLKSRGREFLWIIIGDGPERANLEAQIAEGGLQQDVILHGQDNNPYAYMAGADLYVQTSRFEGFATTLSEAVVLEKPMVSTTFSGVDQQIVDGKNGLLTAFDKNALADRIEQMMFDAALRQRCADGCREIVLPMDQTLQTLDRMFR
jgi:glycosyltransferase involved in cell wall biosynthesis